MIRQRSTRTRSNDQASVTETHHWVCNAGQLLSSHRACMLPPPAHAQVEWVLRTFPDAPGPLGGLAATVMWGVVSSLMVLLKTSMS